MALETLQGIEEINNHKIVRVEWNQPEENHIEVNDKHNAITFKIQNGPIKENGHNGVQVDEIIAVARTMIQGLNKKFPCRENSIVITKLQEAEMWLNERKRERAERGVEGQNKA